MKDKRFQLFAQVLTIRYFMRFRENDEDFIGATRDDVAMPTAKQSENLCLHYVCIPHCMCVRFLSYFSTPHPTGSDRPFHPVIFILSTFTFTRQFAFAAACVKPCDLLCADGKNPSPRANGYCLPSETVLHADSAYSR